MTNRILITGGAGFLGSHLCERLLKEQNHIFCLDNFYTGRKENIGHLIPNPHFEAIRHDIIDPISLDVDEIYNLACPASPVHYQRDPIATIKTSFLGALNLLNMAAQTGAKILQASTSEVYGDPEMHPQREDYWGKVNPIGIRSCYDEGKRAAECLMMDHWRRHHVNVKIVRIFNTYGPRMAMDDGRVVSNFIVQALRGDDLTIYGDGSQTRSFCYVDDLVEGLIRMMHSPDDFTGPVNLGNPGEFTVLELAQQVIRMTSSRSKIIFKPLPQDDPVRRRPDIALAGKVLNWEPNVPLAEGLEKTVAYFRTLI
jgi:UDP-glucuronate decarboxylase